MFTCTSPEAPSAWPKLSSPPKGFDQPSFMRSALRSQESPIARRNDSSMLGKASCATPNPQEANADSGTRASSAVAASASRIAVPKTIGDWRWRKFSLLDPSPTPSTSVTGATRYRLGRALATACASSSSEVMMVAAAPQHGAAMSEAWKYGVRGNSRRNGFPAWMPAGYCAPAWNFRAATRVRKSDTSSFERPRLRLKASIRRSPTASMSSPRRWSSSPSTVRIWYWDA